MSSQFKCNSAQAKVRRLLGMLISAVAIAAMASVASAKPPVGPSGIGIAPGTKNPPQSNKPAQPNNSRQGHGGFDWQGVLRGLQQQGGHRPQHQNNRSYPRYTYPHDNPQRYYTPQPNNSRPPSNSVRSTATTPINRVPQAKLATPKNVLPSANKPAPQNVASNVPKNDLASLKLGSESFNGSQIPRFRQPLRFAPTDNGDASADDYSPPGGLRAKLPLKPFKNPTLQDQLLEELLIDMPPFKAGIANPEAKFEKAIKDMLKGEAGAAMDLLDLIDGATSQPIILGDKVTERQATLFELVGQLSALQNLKKQGDQMSLDEYSTRLKWAIQHAEKAFPNHPKYAADLKEQLDELIADQANGQPGAQPNPQAAAAAPNAQAGTQPGPGANSGAQNGGQPDPSDAQPGAQPGAQAGPTLAQPGQIPGDGLNLTLVIPPGGVVPTWVPQGVTVIQAPGAGWAGPAFGPPLAAPIPDVAVPLATSGLLIQNPESNEGGVGYVLESLPEPFALQAGEQNRHEVTGNVIVRFDRGGNFGEMRYTLEPRTYRFVLTEKGWDLRPVTFKVTLQNPDLEMEIACLVDGQEVRLAKGAESQHQSNYPIELKFDPGDGGQPARKALESGVYAFGIDIAGNRLELYDATPQTNETAATR